LGQLGQTRAHSQRARASVRDHRTRNEPVATRQRAPILHGARRFGSPDFDIPH
jgi:hypothetical protein